MASATHFGGLEEDAQTERRVFPNRVALAFGGALTRFSFRGNGTAAQDVATAKLVYDRATEQGIGTQAVLG